MTDHEPHDANCEVTLGQADYDRALAAYTAEVAAFQAKWPKACEHCAGWGGHYSTYDPSPAGVSLSPGYMTDYDPCPECVEQDRCPRCAEPVTLVEGKTFDHYECRSCQWTDAPGADLEGMPLDPPEPPMCSCEPDYDAILSDPESAAW